MPRAGSGWFYNLIHDLVVASGGQDARSIRERYRLGRLLTEVNCNISTLRFWRLFPVLLPSLFGNEFAIKTHAGPTRFFGYLQQRGQVNATYIFRDPRAALLSAYEYGQRGLVDGRSNAFSHLSSLESAADFMDTYVRIWAEWSNLDGVLLLRYEDLVSNFDAEIERLSKHLDKDFTQKDSLAVIDSYRPETGDALRRGTHFYIGDIDRYRQEFTTDQLDKYTLRYQPVLNRMGYAI